VYDIVVVGAIFTSVWDCWGGIGDGEGGTISEDPCMN